MRFQLKTCLNMTQNSGTKITIELLVQDMVYVSWGGTIVRFDAAALALVGEYNEG